MKPICCGEVIENVAGGKTFFVCRGCGKEPGFATPMALTQDEVDTMVAEYEGMKPIAVFASQKNATPCGTIGGREEHVFVLPQITCGCHKFVANPNTGEMRLNEGVDSPLDFKVAMQTESKLEDWKYNIATDSFFDAKRATAVWRESVMLNGTHAVGEAFLFGKGESVFHVFHLGRLQKGDKISIGGASFTIPKDGRWGLDGRFTYKDARAGLEGDVVLYDLVFAGPTGEICRVEHREPVYRKISLKEITERTDYISKIAAPTNACGSCGYPGGADECASCIENEMDKDDEFI